MVVFSRFYRVSVHFFIPSHAHTPSIWARLHNLQCASVSGTIHTEVSTKIECECMGAFDVVANVYT